MMIVKPNEFTYEQCKELVSEISGKYEFSKVSVIGRSWAGRAIFSLEIGEGDENVLFLGGIKGQELYTPLILFKFFERLCEGYKNDTKISAVKIRNSLMTRKITIVPCLNPDSIEIASRQSFGAGCYAGLVSRAASGDYSKWNANARGVDISHNFNFHHESIIYENLKQAMPSPYLYAGPSPESETETKAVAKLCENSLFKHAFLLRAGGEQIYWSDCKENLSETAMMAKVLSSVSGYPLCRKAENERFGTFCEWFSNEYRRPAFEIKTGNGENPLPVENFNFIYNKIEEMLVLGGIM